MIQTLTVIHPNQPRAMKHQYDDWSSLNNDREWSWHALLPYFKRTERFTPPNPYQASQGSRHQPQFHGFSNQGRVEVGFPNFFYPQSLLWREASGLALSSDLSNGEPEGTAGPCPNALNAANNTRYDEQSCTDLGTHGSLV